MICFESCDVDGHVNINDISSQSNDDAAAKGNLESRFCGSSAPYVGSSHTRRYPYTCEASAAVAEPLSETGRHPAFEHTDRKMGLHRDAGRTLTMLLALKFIAWLVEVGGLLSLHKSCKDGFHPSLDFYHYAQLPQAASCGKILRYLHWATWLQLPLVLALFSALLGWFGGSRVTLGRFRMAFIGILAVACALEMWAANVVLNLADSDATLFLSSTEVTRAKIALCGYCISAAFNALLIIALGDEGETAQYAGSEAGMGVNEPLQSP